MSENKTASQVFSDRAIAFRKAVIDGVKAKANNGVIQPSAEVAREAGMAALLEICDSAEVEGNPFKAMTSISLWSTVFAINDSAFWQSLERDVKNGVVTNLTISRKPTIHAKAVQIAKEYEGMV